MLGFFRVFVLSCFRDIIFWFSALYGGFGLGILFQIPANTKAQIRALGTAVIAV